MRLGDLDKLKLDLTRPIFDDYEQGVIWSAIDNAPTVEPCYQTTSCLDCKNYDKANYYCPRFCEVIREITEEIKRPHGKWIWITEPDGFLHSKCSRCNQFNDWGDVAYCPWCGAEMRGEK